MIRTAKWLMLIVGLAMVLPTLPSSATAQPYPPHHRRRRYVPAPPPPPPHYRRRRRRVIRHYAPPTTQPTPRPRQGISDSRTSIYFGLGPVANMVVEGDSAVTKLIHTGAGLEVFLGFRFSKYAAIELGGLFSFHATDDTRIDTGVLSGGTGDIKIFFVPSSRRIEPFIQLGAGAYVFSREGWAGNELTGGGFQFGGGVDIRINHMIAIGTRLLYRGLFLDNSESTYWSGAPYESTFMNLFSLSANVQLHF